MGRRKIHLYTHAISNFRQTRLIRNLMSFSLPLPSLLFLAEVGRIKFDVEELSFEPQSREIFELIVILRRRLEWILVFSLSDPRRRRENA